MTTIILLRRIAATVAVGLAFAVSAFAQTPVPAIHPVIQKQIDDLKAKIVAARFSTEIQTVLQRDIDRALDPKASVESQIRILDKLDGDVNNTKAALESVDGLLQRIISNPVVTLKIKKYFMDRTNENRRFLPHNYNDTWSGTSRVADQFLAFPDVINNYNAYRRVVAASSKAPAALKAEMERVLKDDLDKMGDQTSALSWSKTLDAAKDQFDNYMFLIDEIVAFQDKTRREVPSTFPKFRDNTVKEAEDIRTNVGNPARPSGTSSLEGLRKDYRERLQVVMYGDEIVRKLSTGFHGFQDIAECKGMLTQLEQLMPGIVDYHAQFRNTAAIEDLLIKVRFREDRYSRGGN